MTLYNSGRHDIALSCCHKPIMGRKAISESIIYVVCTYSDVRGS